MASEMKTALITGGFGYIGSHVTKALKKAGWRTIVVDIKSIPQTDEYTDMFYPCDIRAPELSFLFGKVKIDTVFHLAGLIEVGTSEKCPSEYYDVNVAGTINLLNEMVIHHVKNIVFSSSAGVYGSGNENFLETDSTIPTSVYGRNKLMCEHIITDMQKENINSICLRYFNVGGADPDGEMGENHEPETHLIPRIFQNLNNFTLYGNDYDTPDGTCIRDFIHVSDVADAHVASAEYLLKHQKSDIFNIGSGTGFSNKQIVDTIEKVTGQKVNITYGPRRAGDPATLVANISKAQELLHFTPKFNLKNIISTAYDWHLKHGDN
jgi:UDP-glucose 4-epimerase